MTAELIVIATAAELKTGNKRKDLALQLKKQIISGKFKVGERFPSYEQLGKMIDVSKVTLQNAISDLQRDGYLRGIERKGLFVPEVLPCFSKFCQMLQSHEKQNKFWQKLALAAMEPHNYGNITIDNFRYFEKIGRPAMGQLLEDIQELRLGGLIFTFRPDVQEELIAICKNQNLPKVVFGPLNENEKNPSVISLELDNPKMLSMTLDYFQSKNVRRAALVMMCKQAAEKRFIPEAAARGIQTGEHMIQSAPHNYPEYTANLVKLLLALPPEQRPQGLIINDENLIDHAIRGIIDSGLTPNQDIFVVSHANYPDQAHFPVPIRRIGYDVRKILKQSISSMLEWHISGSNASISIAPEWEDNIS